MHPLLQDLRYGARLLRKNPGFAAISILTLALGIGLTAMMFSIVHGAMLKGLPFPESDRLVSVRRNEPAKNVESMGVTIHDFEDWRAQQSVFTGLAAFYTGTVNISGTEGAERFDGAFITANAFDLLRVRPALGRTFVQGEDQPGAEPVILLGYDVWRSRYEGDPDIVGKTVRANGEEATVIGVMPDGFHFPFNQSVWMPLRLAASQQKRGEGMWLSVFGRLRPGVSVDQANVQMTAIARRLAAEHPETNQGIGAWAQPYTESAIGEEPRALLLTMLGAVFLVLLIACANVANLLLSQAALRMREVGIRSAIGASRRRIVAQFLAEPLALALLGALGGVGLAWLGVRLFNDAIASTQPPFWIDIRVDGAVLLFVLALTLFATFASGVLPALRASSGNTHEVLKDESRGASSFRIGRLSRSLVILEIALSCGLLVGAGLMIKSVTKLRTLELGFDPGRVFTARVGLPEVQYPDSAAQLRYFERLTAELATLREAEAVALAASLPGVGSPGAPVGVEGVAYASARDLPDARRITVAPGFFDVFGTRPLQGRDFGPQDRAGSLPVVIVNQSFARRHFPDGDVLGRRIRLGNPERDGDLPWRTVVGVVPDLFVDGVQNEDPEGVYLPLAQDPQRFMSIVARGPAEPLALTAPVRQAVSRVDADIPLYFVNTLAARIAENTWFYRVFGTIFMVMGFVALFLAAIGLYGVMAFSVSRRTREMGVRMALGARARDVLRLVLRQGASQLAIGLVLGLALAAAVSRLLSMVLFQVEPRDPGVFASIVVVLLATGLIATWFPAQRATRVDPMVALRE